MLEADYVRQAAATLDHPSAEKNVGSEALSALDVPRGVAAQSVRPAGRHVDHRGPRLDQGAGMGQAGAQAAGPAGRGGAVPALPRRERRRAHAGVRGDAAPGAARRCRPQRASLRPPRSLRGSMRCRSRRSLPDEGHPRPSTLRASTRRTPIPWLALYLDQSLPIDDRAKEALLVGNRSWSRRWLFPVARPLIFAFFIVVKILRGICRRATPT